MIDLLTAWRDIFVMLGVFLLLFGVPTLILYGVYHLAWKVVNSIKAQIKEATK